MTTNKPEVVAWYTPPTKNTLPVVALNDRSKRGEPLIRLSDYHTLKAVQEEPVGYVSPRLLDTLRSGKACGITMEDKPDEHNGVTIPLYTTECGCCGQSSRCDDAGRHVAQAEAAELVDALEEIAQWVDRWTSGDHPIATVARKALATYRQKGGKE